MHLIHSNNRIINKLEDQVDLKKLNRYNWRQNMKRVNTV